MCGLATSSRKVAIKLWNGQIPTHLDAVDAAKYLYGAGRYFVYVYIYMKRYIYVYLRHFAVLYVFILCIQCLFSIP